MNLPCITTTMRGNPCVFHGEHLDACVWGQILDTARIEGATAHEIVAARIDVGLPVPERPCRGCVPRPAEHGLLCESCWSKLEEALSVAVEQITHLRSVERGPQSVDGVRVAQGSKILVPGSWQAADHLWMRVANLEVARVGIRNVGSVEWPAATSVTLGGTALLDGWFTHEATLGQVAAGVRAVLDGLGDPVNLVAREAGAVAAVEFFREMQRALHRFPREDAPTEAPWRCRSCGLYDVRINPPLDYLDERVYRCETCHAETDPLMAEWNVRVYAEEVWTNLTDEQKAHLLPELHDDTRRVVSRMFRSDVETMRTRVWERLGEEFDREARVVWFNTARSEWGGLTADELVEAGRGDEVLAAIEEVAA